MKIALFSDVHANLPALEAFFKEVEQDNPDMIYCLGDLVGYNIWPNEVINEIRSRRIPTIAGNYDYGIGRGSNDCGCAYKSEEEKANGAVSIKITNQLVKKDEREYLRNLPAHIDIRFNFNDKEIFSLLLVHGSPRKVNEYLFEDRTEESMLRILQGCGADMLCFGHTHRPYHRIFQEEKTGKIQYYHAVNTGSIGKPKDGDPSGGYVLLHLKSGTSKFSKESLKVEFRRFTYDVERAARAIEKSGLPDAYATALRLGR